MDISELTIKLLLLFFPGIVCYLIVDALVVHRERKLHEIFLLSFVYGVLAYVIYALISPIFRISRMDDGDYRVPGPSASFLESLTQRESQIDVTEIAFVTLIAFAIAIFVSYALNRYWFHDLCRRFQITRKFGQLNVWSFALHTNEVKWATVRDLQNNLMFQGYLRAFSDLDSPTEILLTQVRVYNEKTAEFLYEADHLYLARDASNLTVEFPVVREGE